MRAIDEITDRFESSLGLIITNNIKKFQRLAHKTLQLILARFSGKMPVHRSNFQNHQLLAYLSKVQFRSEIGVEEIVFSSKHLTFCSSKPSIFFYFP